MAFLVKRCWATGFSLLRRSFAERKLGAQMTMMMSTGVNSSPSSRIISPWLMLPQQGGGDMVYKFYNLSEKKEESFPRNSEVELTDAKLVGSSHGWLALFNQRNNNHLYNPITRRHIKLPPIETLPDPQINLTPDGRGSVSKLILSSSPDDDNDECIAMMTFGPGDRLAFCHPCRSSTEWTPIGKLYFEVDEESFDEDYRNPLLKTGMNYGRAYEDFVYCRRLKRFTCITQFEIDLFSSCFCHPVCELEDWDLSDPHSPISATCSLGLVSLLFGGQEWMTQNLSLLKKCRQIPYLIFAEEHNQLFILIRFVMDRVAPDGSYVHIDESLFDPISWRLLVDTYPYKTVGFCVLNVDYHRKDRKKGVNHVRLLKDGSLYGLTMFVGMNHSFAVSSADFPNLKPNSIYFTDANKHGNSIYGGQDIGIFDFANKTLSRDCYPCVDIPSMNKIAPPPMWFTPSLY
ncbi:hypothetical protein CASFOL_000803 [Castilleja foliolosa]|uniref:KIB1-4 beta-propeller domain-containing protein n=1 Tax=Castilleja foliolosa TaxID=1961234 RepID=A0ABD3ELE4_9LAMI